MAIHGQSFRQRDISDNLASAYPKPVDGVFNIGVLHTGMGGMGGHANYAPAQSMTSSPRGTTIGRSVTFIIALFSIRTPMWFSLAIFRADIFARPDPRALILSPLRIAQSSILIRFTPSGPLGAS